MDKKEAYYFAALLLFTLCFIVLFTYLDYRLTVLEGQVNRLLPTVNGTLVPSQGHIVYPGT